jgi:hypothetical protein
MRSPSWCQVPLPAPQAPLHPYHVHVFTLAAWAGDATARLPAIRAAHAATWRNVLDLMALVLSCGDLTWAGYAATGHVVVNPGGKPWRYRPARVHRED